MGPGAARPEGRLRVKLRAPHGPEHCAGGNGMPKILIVDDDRVSSRFLARLLEGEGCVVNTAADGVEGLELLRRKDVDLALIDVWMPGITGLELLGYMRAEGIATKAVIMTSDGAAE